MSFGGMVAAAHPMAAQCGASALDRGGNAFDAAVAVAAALNVVEPFMSGMAGMGFATMWVAAERRVRVLDFVPPVPASFPADAFTSRKQLQRGAASVGLPGNLAGWSELSRRYGRLPWRNLLLPAAAIAEQGFALSEYGTWEIAEQVPQLRDLAGLWPDWCDAYPFRDSPRLGQRVRQPALAATLHRVAEAGAAHLYDGELGQAVIRHLARLGGTLTAADLATVRANWVDPVAVPYRDLTIHAPPPPCEGFQILLALRILDGLLPGTHARNQAGHLDLVIRAIRLAAGERIADNHPTPERLAELLSPSRVASLRERLANGEGVAGPVEQWMAEPAASADFAHTTSFSVADAEGNLVCITQSLGTAFGSGVVVPGTGVTLNNFLHWADVQPGSPNRSGPGSALPMCMAPSIATRDGDPVLALGTPGGYGILQTTVQALVQLLDYGQPLRAAIEAPRLRLWDGQDVELEDRLGPATLDGLRARGHGARFCGSDWTMLVGGMQAVQLDPATGRRTGAADPRRDGHVVPA